LDSNEIDERNSQLVKHPDPRMSTWHGISKHRGGDNEKAPDSICINREWDSNEIDKSDWHPKKHDDPRISTFPGISID
jgi:hypothetical protein